MGISDKAAISPEAVIGKNVTIGPFSVVESGVKIGDGCEISSNVLLAKGTEIDENCKIFHGAAIGCAPQDLKFEGEESKLYIGKNTTIREFCTLNRGTKELGYSKIGSNCLLMAYVHVAHDCIIGDNVILANSVHLGGHVNIGDHAIIGGVVPIHQYVNIGKHVMVAGGFRVVQDIPPFVLVAGEPMAYKGINSIGLKRKGVGKEVRNELKRVYKEIFDKKLNLKKSLKKLNLENSVHEELKEIYSFIINSKRGLI